MVCETQENCKVCQGIVISNFFDGSKYSIQSEGSKSSDNNNLMITVILPIETLGDSITSKNFLARCRGGGGGGTNYNIARKTPLGFKGLGAPKFKYNWHPRG
jgi:hypothetical protein